MSTDWVDVIARYAHELPRPALEWADGHVLGNGDVGGVVWGSADTLSVGLSKHNVWELSHGGPHGHRLQPDYRTLRDAVMAGDRDVLKTLRMVNLVPPGRNFAVSCGILDLFLLRGQPGYRFSQRLSLLEGTCRVVAEPTPFGVCWDESYAPITVSVHVHAARNLCAVRLDSAVEQIVGLRYARHASSVLPQAVYAVDGRMGCMTQDVGDDSFCVALTAEAEAFSVSAARHGLAGEIAFGGRHGPATVLLGVAAQGDGTAAPRAQATAILDAARAAGGAELERTHQSWWHDFWSRSGVQYGDADIAQLWYMGLYALACSTRPHTSPPHLQGIWNHYDVPPWHTDYHFNMNVQQSHWAACTSNHPELQAALVRCLVHDWRKEQRLLAREQFGAPGVALPLCVDIRGRSLGHPCFDLEMGITAWAAQHVWWQWAYTGDRRFLEMEAYPYLRECCAFYDAVLVEDDTGCFNIELTHSPEQFWADRDGTLQVVFGRNSAMDIAMITELFANYLAACRELGVQDAFTERVAHLQSHLPTLPILHGHMIDYATGFFDGGDRPGCFPWSHRHPNRLAAVYPCSQIGLHNDPDQLALGRRSLEEFWSYGANDFSGWSYSYQAVLAARLGLAKEAETALRTLHDDFCFAGLLTSHNSMTGARGPLFQVEALLGMPAALNEMLLQYADGVIHLFPAVPPGREAAFHGLRLPGGITVDAAFDGTAVTEVRLHFPCERDIRLANPWPGATVCVSAEGMDAAHLDGQVLRWRAGCGTCRLMPDGQNGKMQL